MNGFVSKALRVGTIAVAASFMGGPLAVADDLFGTPAMSTNELSVERAMGWHPEAEAEVEDVTVKHNKVYAKDNINHNNVGGNAFQYASGIIINVQNNGHANAISVPVGVAVSISP